MSVASKQKALRKQKAMQLLGPSVQAAFRTPAMLCLVPLQGETTTPDRTRDYVLDDKSK